MTDNDSSAAAGPVHRAVPEGDNRERLLCRDCGFIHYQNPVVVVGAVVTWNEGGTPADERILLCRRAIEPRTGFWTLPAGYLELQETTEAGAIRETWEEALARISIDRLLAMTPALSCATLAIALGHQHQFIPENSLPKRTVIPWLVIRLP